MSRWQEKLRCMRMLTITLTTDSWMGTKGTAFRFPYESYHTNDSEMLHAALCELDLGNYQADFSDILGPYPPENAWYDSFAYESKGQLHVIETIDAHLIVSQCLSDIPVNV